MPHHNVGTADRIIRLVAGVILLSLVFLIDGSMRWIGLIGIIPILTASFRFCPMYCPLRINTAKCCAPKVDGEKKEGGACCGGGSCDSKKDTPAA